MKVVMNYTISRNGKIVVKKGDVMPEAKAKKLKVSPDRYTVLVSKNTPYTREEVATIVRSYLKNDSRQAVAAEFFEVYPDSTNTHNSVMSTVCQLENIDNTKGGGVYHLTELVVQVAKTIAPDRF